MAQVTKRGNSYTIRVSTGYDIKGKQLKRNYTWTPEPGLTKKQEEKELARQVTLFEEKVQTGRAVVGKVKFAEFSEMWLKDYAEKQLAPKTIHRYRGLLVRINQAIGHIRIDKLQPNQLIQFYNNLSEKGIRDDTKQISRVNLKEVIKKHGLKMAELAELTGLSTSTIYAACQGKPISEVSARSISKVIGTSMGSVFSPLDKEGKLSSRTILHHHRLISSILETAVQWQIIESNPATRVKPPKVERIESKYLDDEQAKVLVDALHNEPIQYRTMVTLLIYTGMRRGELCGLKWSDIDFENSILTINRSLQYLPNIGVFEKPPKNSSSNRSIKLPQVAIKLLREYKKWQIEYRLQLGDLWLKNEREEISEKWQDPDRIFTRWNGEAFYPDSLTRWFKKFIRDNRLPDVNIHSLRHTNATLLIAAGTDIRTVSRRLGHAQTSTTANIYAHAIQSADEVAASTLENILSPMNNVNAQ